MQKIILASESPRRREILSSIGMNYFAVGADIEEVFNSSLTIEENVQNIALQKATAVQKLYPDDLIIGADTIVVLHDEIMKKPCNDEDAKRMLSKLSGKTHRVLSGVAIVKKDQKEVYYEETLVKFHTLDENMINSYIATKDGRDKAGAYGIQGKGCILIESIIGDYYNVVGLPIASLYRKLEWFMK